MFTANSPKGKSSVSQHDQNVFLRFFRNAPDLIKDLLDLRGGK